MHTGYPKLPFFFRPYLRWEGPGWGLIYHLLRIHGVDNKNPRWRNAPTMTTRGKWHGYRMKLDLRDDIERSTFFLGRYYDREVQQLLNVLLKPGATFVDVGANVGLTALHAARRVGDHGCVVAIEPNPDCCDRVREAIRDNRITHVKLHQVGLADCHAEPTLHLLGGGTIMSTLAIDPTSRATNVTRRIKVRVIPGDELLASQDVDHLVIKIDVEGYEVRALQGLTRTIEQFHPVIITEVEPMNLRRAGTDVAELTRFLTDRNYRPHLISKRRRGFRWRLHLPPLNLPEDLNRIGTGIDVVWVAENEKRFDLSPYAA